MPETEQANKWEPLMETVRLITARYRSSDRTGVCDMRASGDYFSLECLRTPFDSRSIDLRQEGLRSRFEHGPSKFSIAIP